jgi:hypothetical protein
VMTTYQAVVDVLDETLEALTSLDVDKLEELEGRVEVLAESEVVCGEFSADAILAKKRVLELVLRNCEENLRALHRLHIRNMGSQWAR